MAEFAYSRRGLASTDQPISYLIAQAVANPELISLAAGLVDYETLPTDAVGELARELFADEAEARAALQYGTTEGLAALRVALYGHLAGLDETAPDDYPGSAADVIVATGSQQLLHLLADLLIDPDDIVITAWPSYFVYTGALQAFGATVRCVPLDGKGMSPEALDAQLAEIEADGQLDRVKIVYVCSYHQNPTGLTLAADRRKALLDVVRRYSKHHRILLIEDAAYRELTYDDAPPPSIKREDASNEYVALLQTFSKPFAPGLKTGYGLLPTDLVEPIRLAKGGRDFGSSNLCQHLLLHALRRGVYYEHVGKLRLAYAEKRDAMLEALRQSMPDGVTWTEPTGGLYVWLTLPGDVDTGRAGPLFAAKLRHGVLAVPGEYCYPDDPTRTIPRNHLRLTFGVATLDQIEEGVARLGRALSAVTDPVDEAWENPAQALQ